MYIYCIYTVYIFIVVVIINIIYIYIYICIESMYKYVSTMLYGKKANLKFLAARTGRAEISSWRSRTGDGFSVVEDMS